jgi:SNF2 family DNA or RNA helicase
MVRWQINTQLLSHQTAAAAKLKGLRVGGLFMEMGTGKTLTLLELVCQRWERIDRVIYFCPVNLKLTVKAEIDRHTTGMSVYIFDDKTTIGKMPAADIYIVGVESIGQSDRVTLSANHLITDRTLVILDESDTCKNHQALRTQRLTQMCARARYRFIATGTAVGEGIVDLYAQMYFLSPDILGYKSFYSFARNHLEYSEEYKGLIIRSLNPDVIAKRIDPYIYQVKKDECLDLPDCQYLSRYLCLSAGQRELYHRAKDEILGSVEEVDSYTIFRLFTALREIVSGFWHRLPDPNSDHRWAEYFEPELLTANHDRIDLLRSVVCEIPPGEKVIIWVNFRYCIGQVVEMLEEEYGSDAVCEFHGLTLDRDGEIDRWRKRGRFLVMSPKCGGRGLTLNECAYSIFYNNDFPYRVREQAEARNLRIGQDRSVAYIDLICRNSIDERIFKALLNKENLVQAFKREMEKLNGQGKKRLLETI